MPSSFSDISISENDISENNSKEKKTIMSYLKLLVKNMMIINYLDIF
jgi:hypothetical protein